MRETSPFPVKLDCENEAATMLMPERSILKEIGLAEALYENNAEWPDELAFSKGDQLRVLDQRPGEAEGLAEGWWLCADRDGNRGIAPANRLRMMHRFYENNAPQKIITPQRYGDLFMFNNNNIRLGPNSSSNSFDNRCYRDPPMIYADEDLDRVFPFSTAERFVNNHRRFGGSIGALSSANNPGRRISLGDGGERAPAGLVRNIPIRIEQSGDSGRGNGFGGRSNWITPGAGTRNNLSANWRSTSGGGGSPPSSSSQKHLRFQQNQPLTPDSTASSSSASDNDDHYRNSAHFPLQNGGKFENSNGPAVTVRMRNNEAGRKDNGGALNGHRKSDYDQLGTIIEKPQPTRQMNGLPHPVDFSWRPVQQNKATAKMDINLAPPRCSIATADDSVSDSSSLVIHPDELLLESPVASVEEKRGSGTSSLSDPGSDSLVQSPMNGSNSLSNTYDVPSLQAPVVARTAAIGQTAHISSARRPPLAPKPVIDQKQQRPGQVAIATVEKATGAVPKQNTSMLQKMMETFSGEPVKDESTRSQGPTNPGNDLIAKALARFDARTATPAASADLYDSIRPGRSSINGQSPPSSAGSSAPSSGGASDVDGSWKKHALCSKMSECLRKIEIGAERIAQYTAPRAWRQPHILQQNLADMRSAIEMVTEQMGEFVDATARIAIERSNPLAADFNAIAFPLRESRALIRRLKTSLDNGGWTLAALSRQQRPSHAGNDALDQFVAIISQVPKDCRLMFHWLNTQPAATVMVLVPSSASPNNGHSNGYNSSIGRLPPPVVQNRKPPPSISVPVSLLPSSSNDGTPVQSPRLPLPSTANNGADRDNEPNSNGLNRPPIVNGDPNPSVAEPRVFEEDDLESVASDQNDSSLYQDYAFVGEPNNGTNTNGIVFGKVSTLQRRLQQRQAANSALSESIRATLTDDDRELLRFYAPQLESHTDALSTAIDDFLTVIEEQMPPRDFVQKGKLIILAAHKLIYIGDNIAQCVSTPSVSREVRTAADRLCTVLKECVGATKTAADQYPSIPTVQAMVDSVVTVSHSAHDLKLLVKQCTV